MFGEHLLLFKCPKVSLKNNSKDLTLLKHFLHNSPWFKGCGFHHFCSLLATGKMKVLELPVLPVEDVYLPGAPVTLQAFPAG